MSLPEAIFAALVLLVGVPAMCKNATAIGLVMSWLVIQSAWLASHTWSTGLQFVCDLGVIAIMVVKPDHEDGFPYRSLGYQFAALFWTERTPCDRIIGLIFPAMWVLYVADMPDYYRWWGLWWLAAAQLIAAGVEPLRLWIIQKIRERHVNETPPRVLRVGLAGHA
jgi:hypothetical protein